ncbi:MAG: 4Fe-4S domain-containing protein, partial [Anaerolineae bacterium]
DKLARAREDINRLIVRLSDILRADLIHSEEGRSADSLRAAVGTRQQGLFDFDTMAGLLSRGRARAGLGERRRERIESVLKVLRSQRFFPDPLARAGAPADVNPYEFRFDACRTVREVYAKRLPKMAALVRAMAIAELEVEGRYDESHHDAFFEAFDADAMSRQDLAIFPDYLVCLRGRARAEAADVNLMELLSSGIPVKVLVEVDDLLEEAAASEAHFAFGVRSVQLASLAMALNDAFVMQSASSNLPQLTGPLRKGLSTPAPALVSVYTATAAHSGDLPLYLVSAAAMQSRAFPAFTYDPSAGADMASRFSLEDNPQPLKDWPCATFEYADASLQRISRELAFTLADFVAADPRYAGHFARVPHPDWDDSQVPVADWLKRADSGEGDAPCVLAVDEDDVLHRLVVDEKLVEATRRCLENWHRLQEMGGVHNSHAEALLAEARAAWEEEKRREIDALTGASTAAGAAPPAPAEPAEAAEAPAAEPDPEEEPEPSPDEAWIETVRCSSCNECTQINSEMFAYNENQQAYIKDLRAGTYRQLVEAAESCQLSIIHPGKPWDSTEPGLEELVERAQPFI